MLLLMAMGLALAGETEKVMHRCDVSAGVGTSLGFIGLGGGCDITTRLGAYGGVGVNGESLSLRVYPEPEGFPGVYLSAGYAPVSYYNVLGTPYVADGLAVMIGKVKRTGRLSLTGAIGFGLADLGLLGTRTDLVLDLAIGVNFGTLGTE